MKLTRGGIFAAICLAFAFSGAARANPSMLKGFSFEHPIFLHAHPFAKRHVVVQVSQGDPARWHLVLNNVQNMLNAYGQEKVQIVVVAYGPGLKMILAKSPEAKRVAAMNQEGVEFDACHNTMLGMARKLGHMPKLLPEADIVPGGIVRIMQLQTAGFNYIKP
jgi:uncharacterized protein